MAALQKPIYYEAEAAERCPPLSYHHRRIPIKNAAKSKEIPTFFYHWWNHYSISLQCILEDNRLWFIFLILLPSPAVAVETAEIDGFGEMLGGDGGAAREIGDGAGDL